MRAIGDQRRRRIADARTLAATPTADPYRGALRDPYTGTPDPLATAPPGGPPAEPRPPGGPPAGAYQARWPSAATGAGRQPGRDTRPVTPTAATAAGILGILLAVATAVLGLLLLALLSLQHSSGVPDRSFYQGTDAGYLVLALVDFILTAGGLIGGIGLLGGRVAGRVLLTGVGWGVVFLSMFWSRQPGSVLVPIALGTTALLMLALAYQADVTRWLGVRPPPQPR